MRLSENDIAAFARDGYVVLRGFFRADDMAKIVAWTNELERLPEAPGRHWVYREDSLTSPGQRIIQRIENFYPHHAAFAAFLDGPLRGLADQLFGEPAVLFKDKINFKKPGGDGFKPHQDQQAGWGAYADLFITAMVSIDTSTPENGCLEFAPGHHKRGLIGAEWKPLTPADMTGMTFMAYPTEPGDIVLFDSYAPHQSGPNRTATERRILYITYNRRSAGDHRVQYYADKHKNLPPDIEREPGKTYVFRV